MKEIYIFAVHKNPHCAVIKFFDKHNSPDNYRTFV